METDESADAAFAKNLKRTREQLGRSQQWVAEQMTARGHDWLQTTVYKSENGSRKISIGEAMGLAASLGVDLSALLSSRSDLASQYVVVNRTRGDFRRAQSTYVDSMVQVAAAADKSEDLSDRDLTWLREGLIRQTPGDLIEDAQYAVTAAISREGINPEGEYVKQLTEAIWEGSEWSRSRWADG